ncbi:MAG TPA: NAD(P)-dependent oxidoreductase [Phycisphaerales bacterium]|nr:NAD(P)-dependent oxidoreductase [Phycisphaerales bacterium]
MRIALTGASGFIGSVIARRAHAADHQVTALVRPTSRMDHIRPFVDRFVTGQQDDESAWPEFLQDADVVVHCSVDWTPIRAKDPATHLRTNLLSSINLLYASSPRQFIYISSIAVHHDMRPRWHGQIDEDHPLRPSSLYGALKASVEAHLWHAHFADNRHTCAVRPCAVYGIDPALDRSIGYPIINDIKTKQAYARAGGGKFVHVDDVALAVINAIDNPSASGRAYNLADTYARWADLAVMASDILDIKADIDLSSPPHPKNHFTKDAAHSLGVALDRGHDGLRDHIQNLISVMNK